MQLGPRIRIGGSVGKLGQKAKITVGKLAQKTAPIVSLVNPAMGAAFGAAGDILDTSEGSFSIKKAALDAGRNYAIGKVAGGLQSMAKALAEEPRPPGIKAYHGSPHDFDKFDMSKIGTGEGAQAYGHGLYLAENEATAKQ